MADQKIVIDARINRKAAEADLKALKAETADTARQIASLGKKIETASSKRLKLGDDLKAAQQAAEGTAKAITELQQKIALNKQYDVLNKQNQDLTQNLQQQDQKVAQLTADYKSFLAARDKAGDSFTPEQAAISEQVNAKYKQQIADAQRAEEAIADQIKPIADQMDQLRSQGAGGSSADDEKQLAALTAQLEKQQAQVSSIEDSYKQQEATVTGLKNQQEALNATLQNQNAAVQQQQKLVASLPETSGQANAAVASTADRISQASRAATYFGRRLRRLVTGALVFNLISSALRTMVNTLGTAIVKTNGVQQAFAQLKGSAATAAAGLASALAPAITWILNLLSSLLNTFIRLISLITGKGIGAMKKQGKAISSTGAAAGSAAKSLAKFDDLDVLNKDGGGGGGSGADFSGISDEALSLSDRMKELIDKFKEGFKKGFGDAGEGLANIKADLAKIGALLKEIWTDPAVSAAVKRFADTCAYALGEIVGSAASIGVSIAENLVGGLARYLERSKEFLKTTLANIFNLGADLVGLFGDFSAAVATVFRSLGSEGAKQLTSGFIGIFVNSALGMVQTIEQIGYALAAPLLQPFIDNAEKIRELFTNLFTLIAPFFVGISDGIANFYTQLGNLYNEVLRPLIDDLASFNSSVLGSILDKVNDFLESLTGTSDALHDVGEKIGWIAGVLTTTFVVVSTGIAIFNTLKTVVSTVSGIFTGLQTAATLLAPVISALAGPLGIAIAAIAAAIAIGVLLYQNWDTIKAKASELADAVQGVWNTYISPVIESAKTAITNLWNLLVRFWQTVIQPILRNIMAIVTELWNDSLKPLWDKVKSLIASVISLVRVLCQWVLSICASIMQGVLEVWNQVLAPLINWLIAHFGPVFKDIFAAVGAAVKTAVKLICDKIEMALDGLKGIIDFLTAVFKGDWESAWNSVHDTFTNIWEDMQKFAEDALSGIQEIVDNIAGAISGVFEALGNLGSKAASAASSVGNALSGAPVSPYSASAPLTSLPVPALARGAVIPANHEFLAVLGDQTNGTNVEAPLATIQQALAEVLAAQGGQDITIRFGGDLAQLVRLLKPYIDKETTRRGTRLVTGGVY